MIAQFSQAVSCLYRDMQKIERMEMERYGLKAIHGECLLALMDSSMTAARLGEICDKDKAAVSRAVADLENQGLLTRQGRYRIPLTLTEAGREAAMTVARKSMLEVQQAGEGLSEEKQKIFYEVAAQLAGNLHTICKTISDQ